MAGIYVHIPFCSQSCFYCDFHFSTSLKNKDRVVSAIQKELQKRKTYLKNQEIKTVYFGGGTPSLIPSARIKEIYSMIKSQFIIGDDIEFTIESNPENINLNLLNEWYDIGVNRISLGVQSFNDEHLKYMNRSHDARQAIDALETLHCSRFDNLNVDLIYGFPSLSNSDLLKNLELLKDFNVKHISCYCLTVEKNTPLFHFIKKGVCSPLDARQTKTQFLLTRQTLIELGYDHYEISNFAEPGYQSQHNKNYWNQTHYLGVGPSAHSFNGKSRQWNISNNIKYCNSIENNISFFEKENLSKKNIINEYILTSLRTFSGMNVKYFEDYLNTRQMGKLNKQLIELKKRNLIKHINDSVSLTESGMLIADSISSQLFLI